MKKVTAIFLFLCLTVPFLGTYCWFLYSKYEIKKEVNRQILAGMEEDDLVLLTFTPLQASEKLRWEHADEFEYDGQMYDVVDTQTGGESIKYLCFRDHKETRVNLKIRELISKAIGNHPQNRENTKRLITFLQTSYLQDHFSWDPGISVTKRNFPPVSRFNCSSGFYQPSIPPPKTG